VFSAVKATPEPVTSRH